MVVVKMRGDPVDPKNIWMRQEAPGAPVTAAEMRRLRSRRRSRARWMRVIFWGALVLYIGLAVSVRLSIIDAPTTHGGWFGVVRFAFLITWILTYRHYRTERILSLNLHTPYTACAEFYRRELQSQIDYFSDSHRWMPGLPFVILFFVEGVTADPGLAWPFAALFVIFAAIWYLQWRRELPELQSEMQALEFYRKDG
jgi:uncharacterized membrane protein (DUF485 family)